MSGAGERRAGPQGGPHGVWESLLSEVEGCPPEPSHLVHAPLTDLSVHNIIPTGWYNMSPRSAANTREKLLAGAINLALSKGFAATAVDEVCAAANVTKGAFFYYFKSKEALGEAMLERWISSGAQSYGRAPFLQRADPLDRLYGYIEFTIELTMTGPLGCLVGIFSQELWQTHPSIRTHCAEAFDEWAEGLQQLIEEAKTLHAPDAPFEPKSLAYHFIGVFEGALILARSLGRKEVVAEHLNHFKRYVKALFEEK